MSDRDAWDKGRPHTGRWARTLVCVIGACYLVLGVAGLVSGPGRVLVFSSGALLDVVRAAVGVLCLTALHPRASATALGWFLFVGFTALVAYGVPAAIAADPADVGQVFPLSWADNVAHLVTALLGLAIGMSRYPVRDTVAPGEHRND
ncbi:MULTISPECIES: DUF4383 domain-containing protein [Prauserella salsuginis group]|uniref:DUF4383 domain-containing protein n=2 Tax=Prauserella salsuginis group TaxID=2893672 RepID=A0A839XN13_9PSEU|nr:MULTISPECIES: DUF4383 domain-containing protein [Prauserella salsuginis group]MBB3664017.1 hypothetical protein [Prauserella sediminis]MCR3721472.1 protein of unknown function (DUF4383) [Prauserella flava]MCR3732462.1 protein of unknown function (DUF4383) [Prauserella salsuginis]